jgi:hypothetical protein
MVQQKRGFKFALSKIESLLEVVKAIIPIGNPDCDKILNEHASCYPTKDCTATLLKRKFQELAHTKIPTEDPNMPPHICKAKHIYYRIVQATEGSTGGSEDGADLDNERNGEFKDEEEDDDEEGGMVEVNNNSFTLSADDKQLTMDDDNGSQIDAAAAVAGASGRQASDGNQSSVSAISSEKWRVGAASSSREMRDGGQKKHAFSMPFKTPRKRSSRTDNSNDDGFLFGSMMCMMMHQSWMESEQRERQNKQREHQHRIDAELREREYKLCREEMVIAHEKACAQWQLMNVMMMLLLNKNGGDNVPCPPGIPMDD